jgi:hypothetical protein
MRVWCTRATLIGFMVGMILPATAWAQNAPDEDVVLDTIRVLSSIGSSDQRRIRDWVDAQLAELSGPSVNAATKFQQMRTRITTQFGNANNTPAFNEQFAAQLAQVAADRFSAGNLDPQLMRGLARGMMEINRIETVPGLLAGLENDDQATRYLSATTLGQLRRQLSTNADQFTNVVRALREAGTRETNGVVLRSIYRALSYEDKVGDVLPAFLAIMDARLAARRGGSVIADGGEEAALQFFAQRPVANAVGAEQRKQLVNRLAPFARMLAARYQAERLPFAEQDHIERTLWLTEEVWSILTGQQGQVREVLENQGRAGRPQLEAAVVAWIGSADQQGILNSSPWDVPVGAP